MVGYPLWFVELLTDSEGPHKVLRTAPQVACSTCWFSILPTRT